MRDFVQAGAQRFQYELIKALDKNKYHIDVLGLLPLGSARESGFTKEYYFQPIKDLVNDIILLPQIQQSENKALRLVTNRIAKNFRKLKSVDALLSPFENNIKGKAEAKLLDILNQYDYVNCAEYDYVFLKNLDFDIHKLLIMVFTSRTQTYPGCPYVDYDYNKKYNFVATWFPNNDAFEFENFKNGYNVCRLKLMIDTSNFKLVPYPKNSKKLKIGIFTRIDYRLKPLDPFFYAFHILRNRGLDIDLHIYGAGDSSGFKKQLKTLLIQDNVHFEGHQEDLQDCLDKNGLHLVWFQGVNYEPGGYAAYEVMGRAVPNMFWDFNPRDFSKPQGADPYPMFWDIEKFVVYAQHLLYNLDEAEALGVAQRNALIETQAPSKVISIIENYYDTNNANSQPATHVS